MNHTPTIDRVRAATPDRINREIDRAAADCVRRYEGRSEADLTRRIAELDGEWDIERCLETTAASFGLTGIALGAFVDKRWLVFPGVVLSFLLQHALQGWCPPVPVFRRMGVRTRKEIEREKYALKALRGDFARVHEGTAPADEVLEAVRR